MPLGGPKIEERLYTLRFPLAGSWQCILAALTLTGAVQKMDDTHSLLNPISYEREPQNIIETRCQKVWVHMPDPWAILDEFHI